ncbi:MAG TPA: DUF6036 family nucleotidyltransferase [Bdellovibrionota bacterium]|nr:DUF6036 family nucleotidyltransferase [Bdellovibrionota bacterium]
MKRREFEHAVRAAGAVLGTNELLVIGSQALHGSNPKKFPKEAERSVEVDIAAWDDSDGHKADLLDGSIGEASMFHETFGYYAQGVTVKTAVLPKNWRKRLIRYETPATRPVVAWCLEIHDLWISKAVAGRPKDLEFCKALLKAGAVDPGVLTRRLADVSEMEDEVRNAVERRINHRDGVIRRS